MPGRGLDEHTAAVVRGQFLYFHQNAVGSVLAVSDATGQVLERYRCDVNGDVAVLGADGNVLGGAELALSPYLFAGRPRDAETGLYYFRNRYYSPTLGRFISPDPLDYVDGMNVYAYVNGNVVNLIDPMALASIYATDNGTVMWRERGGQNGPVEMTIGKLETRSPSGWGDKLSLGAANLHNFKSYEGIPTGNVTLSAEVGGGAISGEKLAIVARNAGDASVVEYSQCTIFAAYIAGKLAQRNETLLTAARDAQGGADDRVAGLHDGLIDGTVQNTVYIGNSVFGQKSPLDYGFSVGGRDARCGWVLDRCGTVVIRLSQAL